MTPTEANKIATDVHMKNYEACCQQLENIIREAANKGLFAIKYNEVTNSGWINIDGLPAMKFDYNKLVIDQVLEQFREDGWNIGVGVGDKVSFTVEW
jgi:hypothetical protein